MAVAGSAVMVRYVTLSAVCEMQSSDGSVLLLCNESMVAVW